MRITLGALALDVQEPRLGYLYCSKTQHNVIKIQYLNDTRGVVRNIPKFGVVLALRSV